MIDLPKPLKALQPYAEETSSFRDDVVRAVMKYRIVSADENLTFLENALDDLFRGSTFKGLLHDDLARDVVAGHFSDIILEGYSSLVANPDRYTYLSKIFGGAPQRDAALKKIADVVIAKVLKPFVKRLPALRKDLQDAIAEHEVPKKGKGKRQKPKPVPPTVNQPTYERFKAALKKFADIVAEPGAIDVLNAVHVATYADIQSPLVSIGVPYAIMTQYSDLLGYPDEVTRNVTPAALTRKIEREGEARRMSKELFNPYVQELEAFPATMEAWKKVYAGFAKKIEKSAEAPPAAPLGRIAFAPRRPRKPYEPNTKREDELYEALRAHLEDRARMSPNDAEEIMKLLKKGWYADVFKAPTKEVVYRGINVTEEWLRRALGKKFQKLTYVGDEPKRESVEASFVYTPAAGTGSSSWSLDLQISEGFAGGGPYRAILHARPDANLNRFVAGPKGFYNVVGLDDNAVEQEVIGLGKIKVFKVWYTKAW